MSSGRGVLLNVASLTAYMPTPGMAVYAASKAFVLRFTEALAYELRDAGVTVMAFSPGPTKTEFYRNSGTDEGRVRFETPEQVVAAAFRALDKPTPPGQRRLGQCEHADQSHRAAAPAADGPAPGRLLPEDDGLTSSLHQDGRRGGMSGRQGTCTDSAGRCSARSSGRTCPSTGSDVPWWSAVSSRSASVCCSQ
ncbi:SDR family NAD(P)-dependent oxidoreductase [Curtobacterium sp. MCJR17_043]|uniref:SDR family NAD(P)-dependent oxidoreductase n=1 Tax=Curtobacterium sp. MCJR17_043 TaxID=2175660 RepID=UPI0024E01479|nr:SDR family NAD(P)-dependent oxidoreductase [Curtobacterium sp. MCJR17_043]WIB36536.1 SDR family NAD(P)-dependent oxidoreductase [Curtobacterium sp. MCJR17_043]